MVNEGLLRLLPCHQRELERTAHLTGGSRTRDASTPTPPPSVPLMLTLQAEETLGLCSDSFFPLRQNVGVVSTHWYVEGDSWGYLLQPAPAACGTGED